MIDQSSTAHSNQEEPLPPAGPLSVCVAVAEDSGDGESFEIVLLVAGAIVSGTLISGARYFDLLCEQSLRQLDNSAHDAATAAWSPLKEAHVKFIADGGVPLALHLRNAQIQIGATSIQLQEPGLWRAQIADVAGYTFGRLTR